MPIPLKDAFSYEPGQLDLRITQEREAVKLLKEQAAQSAIKQLGAQAPRDALRALTKSIYEQTLKSGYAPPEREEASEFYQDISQAKNFKLDKLYNNQLEMASAPLAPPHVKEAFGKMTARKGGLQPTDLVYTPQQKQQVSRGEGVVFSADQADRLLAYKMANRGDPAELIVAVQLGQIQKLKATSPELYKEYLDILKPKQAPTLGSEGQLVEDTLMGVGNALSYVSGTYQGGTGGAMSAAQAKALELGYLPIEQKLKHDARPLAGPLVGNLGNPPPITGVKPEYEHLAVDEPKAEERQFNQLGGVPLEAITDFKVLGAALEGYGQGMVDFQSGEDRSNIDVVMKQTQEHYKKQAAHLAIKQFGSDAPRELLREQTKSLYEKLQQDDLAQIAVNNPNMARFLHEVVVDPVNLANPMQVARAVGEAIPPLARGAQAIKRGLATTPGINSFFVRPDTMAIEGYSARGDQLASQMRLSEQWGVSPVLNRVDEIETSAVLPYKNKFDTPEFMELREQGIAPESLPQTQALMEYERGAQDTFGVMRQTGMDVTTKQKEGVEYLAKVQPRQNWVYHGLKEKPPTAPVDGVTTTLERTRYKEALEDQRIGPSFTRTAKNKDDLLRKPYSQFSAALNQVRNSFPKHQELRNLAHLGRSQGYIKRVPLSRKGVVSSDELAKRMAAEDKIPYTVLRGDEAKLWEMHTAPKSWFRQKGKLPGRKLGENEYVMPDAMAQRFLSLTEELAPAKDLVKIGRAINQGIVRPANQFARSSGIMFKVGQHLEDFQGAMSLVFTGNGLKGFSPKKLKAALAVSASLASKGGKLPEKLASMDWPLLSGQRVKMGELVDIYRQAGFDRQTAAKLRMDLPLEDIHNLPGILQGPSKVLRRANQALLSGAEKVGALQAMKFNDNAMRFTTFMGVLKSTKAQDVAEAVDFVSKFNGNFQRMPDIMKHFLNDNLMYPGWLYTASKAVINTMANNPGRLAFGEKVRENLGRAWGEDIPVQPEAVPYHLRSAIAAPYVLQPPKLQKYLDDPKHNQFPDSEEFTMLNINSPYWLGATYWTMADSENPKHWSSMMAPVQKATYEVATGINAWAQQKQDASGALKTLGRSLVGENNIQFAENIAQLYEERNMPEQAVNWRLRIAFLRWLGIRGYLVNPVSETMKEKEAAIIQNPIDRKMLK